MSETTILICEPHHTDGGSRRYGGKLGYGLKPSVNAGPHEPFPQHPEASLLPASVSLEAFCPPVMDQGQTASCVGHSTSGAVCASLAFNGHPLGFVPSPQDGYTLARCLDRKAYGGVTDPLTDDGTDPAMCAQAYEVFGCRPMQSPTSDGRFSDCEEDPKAVNAEPNLKAIEKDAKSVVIGIKRINSHGRQRVLDFKSALASGKIIRFSIDVDGSFEAYGGGVLSSPSGQLFGGHALYAHSYRTASDASCVGKGRNSWGTSWGLSGDFEFDESFIMAMTTIDVVDAKRV